MFREAKDIFDLAGETRASLSDGPLELSKIGACVMQHVRECRRQAAEKWREFTPGPPMLVKKRFYDVERDHWVEEAVMVQISEQPFGRGAIRECFLMKEVRTEARDRAGSEGRDRSGSDLDAHPAHRKSADLENQPKRKTISLTALASSIVAMKKTSRTVWVAKRAIKGYDNIAAHRQECEMDVMQQAVSKHYAELFNTEVGQKAEETGMGRCGAHNIDFLLTHLIELPDGLCYSVEAYVYGDYTKHNNNSGAVSGCRTTPQSFSYFTFYKSEQRRLIVDIQGVDDLFTDPVIHFLPSSETGAFKTTDSPVNLGIRGFALFIWSHRFNNIDRMLGLPTFPLAPAEIGSFEPVERKSGRRMSLQMMTASTLKFEPTSRRASVQVGMMEKTLEFSLVSLVGKYADAAFWESLPQERSEAAKASAESPKLMPLPPRLIEAACHMEIAVMYNEGRLSLNLCPNFYTTSKAAVLKADVTSAIFHLVKAAEAGLPEALMALARLASDRAHEDFFLMVKSTEDQRRLCLVLLARAADTGCAHAHGALAGLLLEGEVSDLRQAANHLACFARAAPQAPGGGEDGVQKHELSTKHGCCFGWEDHGWLPHAALAKAAELYDNELKEEEGSRDKARELWETAAELAMEDPCLAKQAMRYSARAEALADDDEE